jgi:hypothetical protein
MKSVQSPPRISGRPVVRPTDLQVIEKMVRPERFELPTLWFVAKCSIQLSYGRDTVQPAEIDYSGNSFAHEGVVFRRGSAVQRTP